MSVSGIFFLAGSPGAADVARCSVSITFFRTKQHFGSFPPSETVELGRDCSLDSFAIEPAYCPLREHGVTALQCMQGRSIIKGIAEH